MRGESYPTDGGALAVAVRSLASDVKRVRNGGGAAQEVAVLTGQINRLRLAMQSRAATPISRWLDNLERELNHG